MPHREPILLLDRLTLSGDIPVPFEFLRHPGQKAPQFPKVTGGGSEKGSGIGIFPAGPIVFAGTNGFFTAIFTTNRSFRALILCEILAPSASVLIDQFAVAGTLPYLIGIDKTRFHWGVAPSDLFETECRLYKEKKRFFSLKESERSRSRSVSGPLFPSF